jgi:hypothetical protein
MPVATLIHKWFMPIMAQTITVLSKFTPLKVLIIKVLSEDMPLKV